MSYLQIAPVCATMEMLNSWERGVLHLATGNYISQGIAPLVRGLASRQLFSIGGKSYRGRVLMGTKRPCSVEECGRPSSKRGMCDKHYHRWWRLQPPGKLRDERLRRYINGSACSVETCDEPILARGMCNKHYKRWWNGQNPGRALEKYHEWHLSHPEKMGEYERKWRLAHRENKRAAQARRKARKANTVSNLTPQQISAILVRGCLFASLDDCEGPLTLAHDVPVSKGGNTTEANVFCLCGQHNSQMGTRALAELLSQLALQLTPPAEEGDAQA